MKVAGLQKMGSLAMEIGGAWATETEVDWLTEAGNGNWALCVAQAF